MKIRKIVTLVLIIALAVSFAACGGDKKADTITIAIPNDATNEGRALLLLQELGVIKLSESAGVTATVLDIVENPLGIEFKEVEAAQVPNALQDVDYAIINVNYALEAGLNPVEDGLFVEGSSSSYVNVIAVYEGNENTDKIKALVAAVQSQQIADYITTRYGGSVVAVASPTTDGYDPTVDYDALLGTHITVAASPTPHAEILAQAALILAEKGIFLDIIEYTDYVVPNNVVESKEVDANYFQHIPYLENFNEENGTHLVNAGGVHVEPMAIYGGKQETLDALTVK